MRAIIWDFDGVIIESESCHIEAEIETLSEYGVRLTPEIAKKYFGLRTEDYFIELSKYFQVELPIEKMLKTHEKNLEKHYLKAELVPHIIEVISTFENKFEMALATSTKKKIAFPLLKKFSLEKYFRVKMFGDEVKLGKPNPEIFLKACSKLGVSHSEAVVIEDSINGFKAAKAAGIFVIGRKAQHNEDQNFSQADKVILDLRELIKLIQ